MHEKSEFHGYSDYIQKDRPVPHLVNCGYFRSASKSRSKSASRVTRPKKAKITKKKMNIPARPRTPTKNLEEEPSTKNDNEYAEDFDTDDENDS